MTGTNFFNDAMTWCENEPTCSGFMIFDIDASHANNPDYCCHDNACNDWCERPQFCLGSTDWNALSSHTSWHSYRKPTGKKKLFFESFFVLIL